MKVMKDRPQQRISRRNSSGNASWGGAPAKKFREEIHQATQVGVGPQQKISRRNSPGQVGVGPQRKANGQPSWGVEYI